MCFTHVRCRRLISAVVSGIPTAVLAVCGQVGRKQISTMNNRRFEADSRTRTIEADRRTRRAPTCACSFVLSSNKLIHNPDLNRAPFPFWPTPILNLISNTRLRGGPPISRWYRSGFGLHRMITRCSTWRRSGKLACSSATRTHRPTESSR